MYAYDGDNLIEETGSTGTATARYAVGLNIDEPLAILQGTTTDYYQADGLGSITSLSNSSAEAETYSYDSFGNLTASSGSVINRFRYTAREFDSETGLYYYRASYYDPVTGRFLNQDPIAFVGGINLYRYVRNNSPTLRDPSGKLAIGAVIGAISGGIYGAIGAKLQCGSNRDIVIAAVVGAALGGLVGAADVTDGALELAIIGGSIGLAADVSGQVTGDLSSGTSGFNIGSALGALVGGGISAAIGGELGALALAEKLPELPVTAGAASIGGGIAAVSSAAGGMAANPSACNCQK